MECLVVELALDRHPVLIGRGILEEMDSLFPEEMREGKAALITNHTVDSLYGDRVRRALANTGCEVTTLEIPDTERAKSLNQVERLCGHMIKGGLDRKSHVIALGGGVVGDLAGFVASSYMRGIGFVNIPTTLLAQVDSSIGGKTGVDLEHGKNLVGSFHQPRAVISDTETLLTLPEEVYVDGLAEVVKYGMILDSDFFIFIEDNIDETLTKEPEALTHIVTECSRMKAKVVSEDERESGIRAILNFGHTLGHAIEAASDYEIGHGRAVSVGMAFAARLGRNLGRFADVERLENLLVSLGLPITVGNIDPDEVSDFMLADKKASRGVLRFVVPDAIGAVSVIDGVADEVLEKTLGEVFF